MAQKIEIGDRVEAGKGADHEAGRVLSLGPSDVDNHTLNRAGYALVAWDSGTRTWTPIVDFRHA